MEFNNFWGVDLNNLSIKDQHGSQMSGKDLEKEDDFKSQIFRNFEIQNNLGHDVSYVEVEKLCSSVIERKIQDYCQNVFKEIQDRALKGHLKLKQLFSLSQFDDEILSSYGKIKDTYCLIRTYMQEHYNIEVNKFNQNIQFNWNEKNPHVYSKNKIDLPRLQENEFTKGFEDFRKNNKFTDFTFVIGAQERNVHKAFFVLRASGFEMVMEKVDRMQLEDVTIQAFDLFLNYIYSSENTTINFLHADIKTIESLLSFIKSYPGLKLDIKKLCECALIEKVNQKISNEDFKTISKIAKNYELEALKKVCQLFELKKENSLMLEMGIGAGMQKLQVAEQNSEMSVDSNLHKMKKIKKENYRNSKPY